jgi:hypothetical protein
VFKIRRRRGFESNEEEEHNIKLAGLLTGYELDVIRDDVATGEDDDVELTEFSDEIESWVIEEFAKIGLLQKYFKARCGGFSKKN